MKETIRYPACRYLFGRCRWALPPPLSLPPITIAAKQFAIITPGAPIPAVIKGVPVKYWLMLTSSQGIVSDMITIRVSASGRVEYRSVAERTILPTNAIDPADRHYHGGVLKDSGWSIQYKDRPL